MTSDHEPSAARRSGGLSVSGCVAGSELTVEAEGPKGKGVLRRRRPFLERCLSLDGARLSTLAESDDDGLVSWVGRECPAPAPAGRSLTEGADWWDEEWQERAYRTLIGEMPGEAERFPGGWVPVFTCPCGDPWCLYTAVKQSVDGAVVTWHELRMVSYRDAEVPGRRGRTRTVLTWEPPELGPNLLPKPFSVGRNELAAALLEAAEGRPGWNDGKPARPREWAVAGVPTAATMEVSWLRAWDRPSWRLARTRYSYWGDELTERLDRILAKHDPLCLRASGLVDAESYQGVSEDLEALMPPLALAQHAAPLLADYFAQVWGLKADPAALSRVGEDVLDAFGSFSGAEGWGSTLRPSLLRRWRSGAGGERA
ncbi:hypothetical protein [Galactobacter valiniphilus]|uniref:hypothetical protein n=1 Tax=Galactobacter valiniphilus TaxID=2676122 RepID=UPI0037362C67